MGLGGVDLEFLHDWRMPVISSGYLTVSALPFLPYICHSAQTS